MATMSVGGLASGLDTASIIDSLMAIERQPRALLAAKQGPIEARQVLLKDFQTKLRALQMAAADLRSPALFAQTQKYESSDPTKVSVASTTGAGVGSYQIAVTQLANVAQRTYGYTPPTADGTITIDGHATNVTAGMSAKDLAAALNSDRDATVYAAAVDDRTIVFSSRRGGDTGGTYIQLSDPAGALTEDTTKQREGRDALYTIDGVARTSKENVITDAILGLTLTLKGVTGGSPVTVSASEPATDSDAITRKLQAFVDAYNATVDAVRSKLTEKSVRDTRTPEDIRNGVPDRRLVSQVNAGTLFGDTQLSSLLSSMRQIAYMPVPGAPRGMDSLAALGITTGATSSTTSADTLAGRLTIDADKLAKALESDPTGVKDLLAGVDSAGGWARGFEGLLDGVTKVEGILDSRIKSGDSELKSITTQIDAMDERLAMTQRTLQAQFTALEVAMSQAQSQDSWLSSQISSLGFG
ncbi:MAG TPA: flagellar filament capping protein FliD [Conexibacter sp.]|jgi:flagellar hook-associated protein 2